MTVGAPGRSTTVTTEDLERARQLSLVGRVLAGKHRSEVLRRAGLPNQICLAFFAFLALGLGQSLVQFDSEIL